MWRILAGLLLVSALMLIWLPACGAQPGQPVAPVYQRRSTVWHGGWQGGGGHQGHHAPPGVPHGPRQWSGDAPSHHQHPSSHQQFSGSSFQRPYPYHLDYYRMKYGGSYAPYFGNLYGPPKVYAPTYLGGQPYGPHDQGAYPPPGEYHGQPAYGESPSFYGQPMVVEAVPAGTTVPAARAPVDPQPAPE